MIIKEQELENLAIKNIVSMVVGAIKTAPKGRGINALETVVLTDEDKDKVANYMINKKDARPSFKRDGNNILNSDAVILIGVKKIYIGLDCGLCGVETCSLAKQNDLYCAFNLIDMGIAIGSAVSSLSLFKVDNRIMYTIGVVVQELKLMQEEFKIIMGIPVKISQKNIFFDRK